MHDEDSLDVTVDVVVVVDSDVSVVVAVDIAADVSVMVEDPDSVVKGI